MCAGVCRIQDDAGLHPLIRSVAVCDEDARNASWCTEIQLAPASANAGMNSSGFSIIRWQSRMALGGLPQRLHNQWSNREIRYEMSVHTSQ